MSAQAPLIPSFPIRPILLLFFINYLNVLSRIVFAPLLPLIEVEFGLGHGQAGSLFLFMAFGFCAGLFGSGFLSSRLNHRRTIVFSAVTVGGAMLATSQSPSVSFVYLGLLLVGTSAGFYLPSEIAILTDLIRQPHWGKAIAIRESAASLGLITAPLLVEFLLRFLSWRCILGTVGASSILMAVLFIFFGQGGERKGEPPNLREMQNFLGNRSFRIMAVLFAISIGAQIGVYAMLPLFLVNEIGVYRELANTIIGLSQISAAVCLFFSGLIADRIGHKRGVVLFTATTGVLTLLLGLIHGSLTTPALILLQATSAACLFPAGFAIVSGIFPPHLRSLAISLVVLVGYFFGAGLVPSGIGYLAEALSFSVGFSLLGILTLAMLPLLSRLRA